MRPSIASLVKEHLEIDRLGRRSSLPVRVGRRDAPIIAMDRWNEVDRKLEKTFRFIDEKKKVLFVQRLFAFELEVGHHARITIDEGLVQLVLMTRDNNTVSELDREYAKYADGTYKDVLCCGDEVYLDRNGEF